MPTRRKVTLAADDFFTRTGPRYEGNIAELEQIRPQAIVARDKNGEGYVARMGRTVIKVTDPEKVLTITVTKDGVKHKLGQKKKRQRPELLGAFVSALPRNSEQRIEGLVTYVAPNRQFVVQTMDDAEYRCHKTPIIFSDANLPPEAREWVESTRLANSLPTPSES